MNVADSQRVASALESLGYRMAPQADQADVLVLNTCVVRQSAEDRATGRLFSLRPLKDKNPTLVINLMGCMVGIKGYEQLKKRFPFVDVFSPPSDPVPLVNYLIQVDGHIMERAETDTRFALMDESLDLPRHQQGKQVSAFIPIVLGCSHACTFCVIPYRRGAERSRPAEAILTEVRRLVDLGVREITLLGQIVDRYGKEFPEGPDLVGLLNRLHSIDGLDRIRFLTSHPNYLDEPLLDCVAELPKVMPHIEVPVQAGDDEILARMKRGYSSEEYIRLVERIRARLSNGFPSVSIATDIIVGFPGETPDKFQRTVDLLASLKLDVAHLARYSPRPGTVAERRFPDSIPDEEKMNRFRILEELQEKIVAEINAAYLDRTVEVLFEEKVRGRWKGRTPTNKLVFVESESNLLDTD